MGKPWKVFLRLVALNYCICNPWYILVFTCHKYQFCVFLQKTISNSIPPPPHPLPFSFRLPQCHWLSTPHFYVLLYSNESIYLIWIEIPNLGKLSRLPPSQIRKITDIIHPNIFTEMYINKSLCTYWVLINNMRNW